MSEKRFKIADYPSDIEDTVTGKKYAMSSYNTHMEIICDLLNELDSENNKLKKVLQYETQMHNKWKTECTNEIKENNKIKNTINEMYNNERTYIGKSTLKQLLEQIQ